MLLPGGYSVTGYALSLVTDLGIRTFSLDEISSVRFLNAALEADLHKALDVLALTRNSNVKTLVLSLSGKGTRDVSLGYVIPSPVWKASYRLDLSGSKPLLQGWAIVDNASENDWIGIELSLVTGKPVSFVQLLYPPYYTVRPVLPLSIAGVAEARTRESGYAAANNAIAESVVSPSMKSVRQSMSDSSVAGNSFGAGYETALGTGSADRFEFTVKTPVTIMRHTAAMLPLVESGIKAEKIYVVPGSKAAAGPVNPEIAVELTNETGMKLPAGPVTVFDGGTYAGDALMEFFPQNEKRIISFGEDLSLIASASDSSSAAVSTVTVSKGIMTITRKITYERTYTVKNASEEEKLLVIEHPVTRDAVLVRPESYDTKTESLYRFKQNVPAGQTVVFTVQEESPRYERVELSKARPDSFAVYAASAELPANIRAALQKATELNAKISGAQSQLSQIEADKADSEKEQERVRANLLAAGSQTLQGQEYLKRLSALDDRISGLSGQTETVRKQLRAAQKDLEDYLAAMQL
jgi:hypothetical protein